MEKHQQRPLARTFRAAKLKYPSQNAIDGMMVVLVPENPGQNLELFRRDQSDSDGSFNLNEVKPGKYMVVAIENGWDLEWSTPAVIQKYLPGGRAVEVNVDSEQTIDVAVQR